MVAQGGRTRCADRVPSGAMDVLLAIVLGALALAFVGWVFYRGLFADGR